MFSATSSLAAAISRIDDDDSSAAAASVSTECAICFSDAVIWCSDAAVSSMAPSCDSVTWRRSSSPSCTLRTLSARSSTSISIDCSRCAVEYEVYSAGTTPSATSAAAATWVPCVP